MDSSFRFRFHIRDLAVLTFIVALLLGLFLPAVNAARESARREQCSNNLKQLGLGTANYSDVYRGWLPYGTWQNHQLVPERRLSWAVGIAAYLEQIYFLFKFGESWDHSGNLPPMIQYRDVNEAPVIVPAPYHRILMCPSRTLPEIRGLSATAYVGPAGLGLEAPARASDDVRNGIWGYDRQSAMSHVADGLGQTILFLETSRDNGPWTAGGPPTVRGFMEERALFGSGRPFGGFHPNGCQAALVDGSVQFLSIDIDPLVFAGFFTIADESAKSALVTQPPAEIASR